MLLYILVCSLSGRNIALNESAEQTSTYSDSTGVYNAGLSVDGDRNPSFFNGRSCSATNTYGSSINSWNVTFSQPRSVNRYLIYNRQDSGIRCLLL